MSRITPRNRYQHPVDIPPLQRTPTGYRRITPRGIQPTPLYQPVKLPRPTVWLSHFAWSMLGLLAFALCACAAALIVLALTNIF